jgi:PAS domain S-box-containing protein
MRRPLRILSIEDDPKDTKLIQDLLETEGVVCEIRRVETQADFLASVEQGGIDLILADYTLPSFDGISALKFAMKACPDVPFIFVTGTLGEEVAIEALKIGATDYILKTRLSRLVPSVQRALREATQKAERKRAEVSLRKSETYLAEAQRLSHTGSFGWKPFTGEITWSEETFRIFQYDPTTTPTVELVLQRVHPDDVARVKQTIERASQGVRNFEHQYRLMMPDGCVKYVHVVAHALSDEAGGLEFAGAVMDVTAAKEAADKVRLIIDTVPGLLWTARPDGAIDFISQRWLDYTGMTLERGLGWGWESAYHPDDREQMVSSWRAALSEGKPYEAEGRLRSLDGEYRWFLSRACPLLDHSGHILGWYGSATDIHDRKQAEEGLRQAQAALAHVSRVTTMGEITASLAHEVKQPITAALTNASTCLLWLNRDRPDLEEAREAAMRMVKDGVRAGEIISRIRELFKKGTPQQEMLDVNGMIRETVVLLRAETTQHSIAVRTELAADLPPLMGDRVQLQQVLVNLMINGIEAMRDVDGVRELAIKSQRGENEHLLVSVSDTGVGLPAQQTARMFDAFFTTKPHGTGMGLRISRSILESHGGRLWAADNPPRGASFYFTLPAKLEAKHDAGRYSDGARR